MSFILCIAALCFLMFMAYRGFSVILFAPIAAMGAVLLTDPKAVLPIYSGLFMPKMVFFVQNYFPAFMLGAIFGKLIELSGFAKSIVHAVVKIVGASRAMLSIVVVCMLLTYFGVSLFVVVFAVYPFAVELFRALNIPKRLIPGTIALGSFTVTMDSLPGTPQIQNIIPTTFFKTDAYAAPWLGTFGAIFIIVLGTVYLEYQRRKAAKAGEGYGTGHINEPAPIDMSKLVNPVIAILPLLIVGFANYFLTKVFIHRWYGDVFSVKLSDGMMDPVVAKIGALVGIWAVEIALVLGIIMVVIFGFKAISKGFIEGTKSAIGGAMLACINTASEYGFGSVIAALPGFVVIANALKAIPNPLVQEAISVNVLAGVTGSASGGLGIALATMSQHFIEAANSAHIPMQVLHRVASMASGGMDTLPHNGAVITLLAVTGLTHRQSYKDIFAVTCIKATAVFVVIALYYLTHLV